MLPVNSLFLQGALFTGGAVLIVILTAWWLYLSPLAKPVQPEPATITSPRRAILPALLLGLAAGLWVGGALWDASMHLQTGEIPAGADFLWPPHLMLYSGFLLSFVVALLAIGQVALAGWRRGERDPRRWVRRNPYLGAVALAAVYELMAIPGDAIWHEIFGADLTAWSPPHVLLAASIAIVILCAIGLLLQPRASQFQKTWQDIGAAILLGLMLNVVYIVGVLEWELPAQSPLVAARPIWYYPLVGGGLAFFTLALARRLIAFRWAATTTALAFYLTRLAVTVGLDLSEQVAPALPLVFILGAVLMDLVPIRQIASPWLRGLALAAAFTAGYLPLALPILAANPLLPAFSPQDLSVSILAMLVSSLLLLPVANLVGRQLLGKKVSST